VNENEVIIFDVLLFYTFCFLNIGGFLAMAFFGGILHLGCRNGRSVGHGIGVLVHGICLKCCQLHIFIIYQGSMQTCMLKEIDCRYSMLHTSETADLLITVWSLTSFQICIFNHGLCQHLLEALLGRLPVDDIPDRLEVLGLAVLVLEAVHH
jgi:hypothetical protein